jgi:hypothetical protein
MAAEAMRLRDITRSKDPLEGLCKERLITPEACDWVKASLDPFHDFQLQDLNGYPDMSTEPTVKVRIRQALTISKPPGLEAGANWDCHVVLSPIDFNKPGDAVTANPQTPRVGRIVPFDSQFAGAVYSDTTNPAYTGRMDGLMINSVPSSTSDAGSLTYTPGHTPLVAAGGYQMQNIVLDDFLDFDDTDLAVYRIVYSGFEVVNTTAQIHKQGAVTVYEFGNSYQESATWPKDSTSAGSGLGGPMIPTTLFRCPPNTLAQAKIMPGAHTWAAQDGCYNTAKFQTDNPFQAVSLRNWGICQNTSGSPGTNSGYLNTDEGSYLSTKVMARAGFTNSAPTHFSRMNTTGAYFTGLSESSTLLVTWRVGIERLPSANNPSFLALATPCAAYDPNALILYNLVANALPPGCPQGYNDAGKWFQWISENAKKAIPVVYPIVRTAGLLAGAMGRPVIGAALTGLGNMMKPTAEDMAARRLQSAAARMKANNNNSKSKKTPAVGNWQQPTPRGIRPGGRNGLK